MQPFAGSETWVFRKYYEFVALDLLASRVHKLAAVENMTCQAGARVLPLRAMNPVVMNDANPPNSMTAKS